MTLRAEEKSKTKKVAVQLQIPKSSVLEAGLMALAALEQIMDPQGNRVRDLFVSRRPVCQRMAEEKKKVSGVRRRAEVGRGGGDIRNAARI